jgi:hypothetical protein
MKMRPHGRPVAGVGPKSPFPLVLSFGEAKESTLAMGRLIRKDVFTQYAKVGESILSQNMSSSIREVQVIISSFPMPAIDSNM